MFRNTKIQLTRKFEKFLNEYVKTSAQSFKLLLTLTLISLISSFFVLLLNKPKFAYSAAATHIVISEIQIAGATSTDEFVELYNPTTNSVDLTGWKLMKKTAALDAEETLLAPLTGSIEAHGFYLIANNVEEGGFDEATDTPPDATYSEDAIASNNSLVLRDAGDGLVDLVGMGDSLTSETAAIDAPITNRSIERKAHTGATEESMAPGGSDANTGNGEDTDNNSLDFVRHVSPNLSQPQNTLSALEVPAGSPTVSPTESISITPSESLTPTLTSIPSETPTMTVTPTVTITTTPTEIPTATLTPTLVPTATPTETLSPTVTVTPSPTQGPSPTTVPTTSVTPTDAVESPTPTMEPEPSATLTPTPKSQGKVIGTFNFPGRHNRVCTLNYKVVRFFFYFIFVPQISCTRA